MARVAVIGQPQNGQYSVAEIVLPKVPPREARSCSSLARICAWVAFSLQRLVTAIASALWNHRMFLLHGDARYLDVLERTIYNGFLSGVALTSDRFFYPNPLASLGQHVRTPWFNCACCPPNVARFIAELGGFAYGVQGDKIYVNMFNEGTAELATAAGGLSTGSTRAEAKPSSR